MKVGLTKPKELQPYCKGILLMNWVQEVDPKIERILKKQPYYGLFTASHFVAHVWYEKTTNKWAAEVRLRNQHEVSYIADSIDQLSFEINQEYGKGELVLMS